MAYPTQRGTLNRLEAETRRASRIHEDACVSELRSEWESTKARLRGIIMGQYHAHHGGENWNIRNAVPTIARMNPGVWAELVAFHAKASEITRQSLTEAYRHEAERQAWMLDQTTPPSYRAVLPLRALRESDAGPNDTWTDALAEWVRAYGSGLGTNLRLEALNEGGITDAADEVDATKVGGFDPGYKFGSMLSNQILDAQRQARADVGSANDGTIAEEIFQTMEDSSVCPDCNSQDGKPVEDVQVFGHVYGFNCRCFTRIVPKSWAQMLRSGSASEKEAALRMEDRGLVPDAMAVLGPDGGLVGHFTGDFAEWQKMRNLTGVGQ